MDVISARHRGTVQDVWNLVADHVITQTHSQWVIKDMVMGWNIGIETFWTGAAVILMPLAIMNVAPDVINTVGTILVQATMTDVKTKKTKEKRTEQMQKL